LVRRAGSTAWRCKSSSHPDRGEVIAKRKGCAVERRCLSAGTFPPGNWFAPPGSNRSNGLGNEAVGAFGVKDRISDSASMQVVM